MIAGLNYLTPKHVLYHALLRTLNELLEVFVKLLFIIIVQLSSKAWKNISTLCLLEITQSYTSNDANQSWASGIYTPMARTNIQGCAAYTMAMRMITDEYDDA